MDRSLSGRRGTQVPGLVGTVEMLLLGCELTGWTQLPFHFLHKAFCWYNAIPEELTSGFSHNEAGWPAMVLLQQLRPEPGKC